MSLVSTIKGTDVQIMISNGLTGTNLAYVHPCMINGARAFQLQCSGTDEPIPDCLDPNAMAWSIYTKTGIKGTITGAGKFDASSYNVFEAWIMTDTAKDIKVSLGGTNGGVWTGAWKLTDFAISGDRSVVASATLTLVSYGALTYGTA